MKTDWEEIYSKGQQLAEWPWSDVVSLFHKFKSHKQTGNVSVLELGCAAGVNASFFFSQHCEYVGIDGSGTAIQIARERFPENAKSFFDADLNDMGAVLPLKKYDIILDRASVSHNPREQIVSIISQSKELLNDNGLYIGVDWHSDQSSAFDSREVNGVRYLEDVNDDQFSNVKGTYFASPDCINQIFEEFDMIFLVEKTSQDYDTKKKKAWIDFVCQKK